MVITMLMDNIASDASLRSEHGLSLHIRTEKHSILFDTGQSAAFADNAEKLGVDLASVDMAILSHGHYDHSGGIRRFFELNDHAPLYLHKSAFERRVAIDDGRDIGLDASLAGAPRLVFTDDILHLDVGLALLTCNQRARRFPSHSGGLYEYRDGVAVQDEFLHEQYLCIREGDKTVLISGCSHKGILNIMDWLKPDILVGGFHYMGLDAEKDRETLEQEAALLAAYDADYYTGHCTGKKQFDVIKPLLGDRLHYFAGGMSVEL